MDCTVVVLPSVPERGVAVGRAKVEVATGGDSIFELLDCLTDDEQVTLLTPVDYCNIVRNMSLHDTRRSLHRQ